MGWLDIVETLGGVDVSQCTNCMLIPVQCVAMLTSGVVEEVLQVLRNGFEFCFSRFMDD